MNKERKWVLPEDLRFKAYMDGDALCVVSEDFINLQESPSFFVKLNRHTREEFRLFINEVIDKKEGD